jgi:hypothetical protein
LGLSLVSYDEEDHHHHHQDDFEDDEREKEDDEVDDDDGGRRERRKRGDDDDDKEDIIIEIIVFNGIDFDDGRVFASNRRRGDHPTVVVKYVAGRARVANRKGVLPAPGRERHPDDERRRCRRRSGARSKTPSWTKRRRDFIDEFFTTSFFF